MVEKTDEYHIKLESMEVITVLVTLMRSADMYRHMAQESTDVEMKAYFTVHANECNKVKQKIRSQWLKEERLCT